MHTTYLYNTINTTQINNTHTTWKIQHKKYNIFIFQAYYDMENATQQYNTLIKHRT